MTTSFYIRTHLRSWELGLVFDQGELTRVLTAGDHRTWARFGKIQIEVVSRRDTWFVHAQLDVLVQNEALRPYLTVVDLEDHERALVWVDGRFQRLLEPGLYALFKGVDTLLVERMDARTLRFDHRALSTVAAHPSASGSAGLSKVVVPDGFAGVAYVDGVLTEELEPGTYAYWRGLARVDTAACDLRETTVDIGGQELMTADRVTLRLNAVVVLKVVDIRRAFQATKDHAQALYRDAQLTLRAVVGGRDLDTLLSDKDAVSRELLEALKARAATYGVAVLRLGIRDIILPGEMKDLMNKVIEARKAAEAAVITRREETSAMRSQANTAKLLAASPALMRLRELETLERVAAHSKLQVILGEQGLADRLVNLV
jgi:regulator of protease activity HflC (stomatin/prohibitin superfamily)